LTWLLDAFGITRGVGATSSSAFDGFMQLHPIVQAAASTDSFTFFPSSNNGVMRDAVLLWSSKDRGCCSARSTLPQL